MAALISTLWDDFATKNTSLWNYGVNAADTNGQLVLTCTVNYDGSIRSVASYSALNSAVFTQVPQAATGTGTGTIETYILAYDSGTNTSGKNCLLWDLANTTLTGAYRDSAGTQFNVVTLTYSATTHAWWRIRVDATGANLYWDTSPDGITWTQQGTAAPAAPGIPLGSLYVSLGTGFYGASTPSNTAIFDNVNPPAYTGSAVTSGSDVLAASGTPADVASVAIGGSSNLTTAATAQVSVTAPALAGSGQLAGTFQGGGQIFRGPVFYEYRPMQVLFPESLLRAAFAYGETVWCDSAGVWHTQYAPSLDQLAGATAVYPGGRDCPLTAAQVAALNTAGYGAYIFLKGL